MWSSVGMTPYMSYTIYYVSQDWDLDSIALSNSFLPENHTAEVLADALEETMKQWNFAPEKQVWLITDSSANIVAAGRNLHWTQISCFGHNLHLAITKALDKGCERAIAVARKIFSVFSCSWRRELTVAQLNMNLP